MEKSVYIMEYKLVNRMWKAEAPQEAVVIGDPFNYNKDIVDLKGYESISILSLKRIKSKDIGKKVIEEGRRLILIGDACQ